MPGKIHVPIAVNVEGVDKVSRTIGKVATSAGTAALAVAGFAAKLTTTFTLQAIEGGRDLERNLEGLATVFKDSTNQMEEFSKGAYTMGLSLSEAAKASTFIGSVLKQSGFSIQETADLTEDLVSLGADLALTYGYDVQEALLGMTALFRGEYDPIEKFGVAMKQSEIDAEKAARGLDHLTGAAERFADQQIRVEFLFERAADAMGAVERQTGNLAVQQAKLQASFQNVRDVAGLKLLPTIAELTSGLADVVMGLGPELVSLFMRWEEPLRRIGESLLPMIDSVLRSFIDFLDDLGHILELATDPTSDLGDALQNVRLLLEYIFAEMEKIGFEGPSFFEVVTEVVEALSEGLFEAIKIVQDALWWVTAFFTALGEFDIFKILKGDKNELQAFKDYVANFVITRQEARDAWIADANAAEDAAFRQDRFNRNQKQAYQDSLDYLRSIGAIRDNIRSKIEEDDPVTIDVEIEVEDPVKDFFDSLEEEIRKQGAKAKLKLLGLSEALAQAVISSGEGWEQVFKAIMKGGEEAAKLLQDRFMLTAAGMEEYRAEVEKLNEELDALAEAEAEIEQINQDLAASIVEIEKEFADLRAETAELIDEITGLREYEREIGRFENHTTANLRSIKDALKSAFDNEMIFEEAYKNLVNYASSELGLLLDIQKQRDALMAQRDLAADTIYGVAEAIAASSNLVGLISDVEDKTSQIQITEVMEGIVRSADQLDGFKTTLTRNFTEVVTDTVNKSNALTNSFQGVIDRTRLFIDNLNKLRELGLDSFLFNQLVQAGVEAGGATAQALVDGGKETVDEVNKLQGELNQMGVELGEMTYLTMKDQGLLFVSGIVDGLNEQLSLLEDQAITMADVFAAAFETAFNNAINAMELETIQTVSQQAEEEIQKIEETVTPTIDQAAVDKLTTLIDNAKAYMDRVRDLAKAAGAAAKISIYEGLLFDVQAGREIDLSGITSGMTTGELAAAALIARGGSPTVNNYNVNVSADSPLTAHQAGISTVNSLMTYQTSSGDYQVTVSGFGA